MRKGKRIMARSNGSIASEIIAKCQTRLEDPDDHHSQQSVPIILAVEDQFVPREGGAGQTSRAKAVSILDTSRHAGGWIYIAQIMGLEIYEHRGSPGVLPEHWRAGQWGRPFWRTEHAKRHAVQLARDVFGVSLPPGKHHTAEAAFIAAYAASEILFRRRVKGCS
jgi:hypothetical protein